MFAVGSFALFGLASAVLLRRNLPSSTTTSSSSSSSSGGHVESDAVQCNYPDCLAVRQVQLGNTSMHELYATKPFRRGQVIAPLRAMRRVQDASRYTLQCSETEHFLVEDELRYMQHSCMPTVFVDTCAQTIVALRDLQPGDLISFFYPATEWNMAEPFECGCQERENGSEKGGKEGKRGKENGGAGIKKEEEKEEVCHGLISGAKHMSPHVMHQYQLNKHIIALYQSVAK